MAKSGLAVILDLFMQSINLSEFKNKISNYFPNIFRSIPEKYRPSRKIIPHLKIYTIIIVSLFLALATDNQRQLYFSNSENLTKIKKERASIEDEVTYWKNLSKEYSNYPDIYLKIASLEYRLGRAGSAMEHLEKAKALKPGLEKAQILEEYITRGN